MPTGMVLRSDSWDCEIRSHSAIRAPRGLFEGRLAALREGRFPSPICGQILEPWRKKSVSSSISSEIREQQDGQIQGYWMFGGEQRLSFFEQAARPSVPLQQAGRQPVAEQVCYLTFFCSPAFKLQARRLDEATGSTGA